MASWEWEQGSQADLITTQAMAEIPAHPSESLPFSVSPFAAVKDFGDLF